MEQSVDLGEPRVGSSPRRLAPTKLGHLAADSGRVPLPWSQCRFASLLDARPHGPIAQGDPGRSMGRSERAARGDVIHRSTLKSHARAPSSCVQKLEWHRQNNTVT